MNVRVCSHIWSVKEEEKQKWCFAELTDSLLKRARAQDVKKKKCKKNLTLRRLLIFSRALILWRSERRSVGGGTVELLIHEITELCNVRNILKP